MTAIACRSEQNSCWYSWIREICSNQTAESCQTQHLNHKSEDTREHSVRTGSREKITENGNFKQVLNLAIPSGDYARSSSGGKWNRFMEDTPCLSSQREVRR